MNTLHVLIALSAGVLCLSACDKTRTTPPTPTTSAPVSTGADVTTGSAADPSVPSAASVNPPANRSPVDPTLGRSNRTMSSTQESTAMPMPGQNNDHSAPSATSRPASSPQ